MSSERGGRERCRGMRKTRDLRECETVVYVRTSEQQIREAGFKVHFVIFSL